METHLIGRTAVALVVSAVVLSAAGPAGSESGVTVRLFQFKPGRIEVEAGARVAWINQDDITHTVTSGTPEQRDGRFELLLDGRGATGAVKLDAPGAYLLLQPAPLHARRDPRAMRPRALEEETTMREHTKGLKRLMGGLALVTAAAAAALEAVDEGWAARLDAPTSAGPAASLRALLSEHVYLASAATSAALGGRRPEFEAAAAALDANSVDVAKAIGSVYGPDAEQAFLPLWRKHIGMVVDYTVGKAAGDRAKQDRAVSDLVAYAQDFGAFLAGANPNLPKAVVADLVKHHVVTLKDVIDAQAAKDPARAFTAQRTGAAHMQMIADPLAEAIVRQFPDRF